MKKLSPKPAPVIYFVINEKNMRLLTLDSLKVGDEIPVLTIPPLTRYTLALYLVVSGGHNPIHVDIDFAKLSGLDEVIVQGDVFDRISCHVAHQLGTAACSQKQEKSFRSNESY